jgi:hypothetical protein
VLGSIITDRGMCGIFAVSSGGPAERGREAWDSMDGRRDALGVAGSVL